MVVRSRDLRHVFRNSIADMRDMVDQPEPWMKAVPPVLHIFFPGLFTIDTEYRGVDMAFGEIGYVIVPGIEGRVIAAIQQYFKGLEYVRLQVMQVFAEALYTGPFILFFCFVVGQAVQGIAVDVLYARLFEFRPQKGLVCLFVIGRIIIDLGGGGNQVHFMSLSRQRLWKHIFCIAHPLRIPGADANNSHRGEV